jgi:hypothetical protein
MSDEPTLSELDDPDGLAWFCDDLVPMPPIKSLCLRCKVSEDDVDHVAVVVSPTRKAHFGADDGETSCGLDATGDNWWWPL